MSFRYVALLISTFALVNGLLDHVSDSSLEAKVLTLTQKVEQLQQTVAALQNQKANQPGPVAFTAYLSKSYTSLGQHQQIVFDHVITNTGSGYNVLHGHFTAPVRGVYVFFVMITNTPNHSSSIYLMKNGHWIGSALADDISSSFQTSTLTVTVELQTGDQVWVQNEASYSDVEHIDGSNWSSFSGHLIEAN